MTIAPSSDDHLAWFKSSYSNPDGADCVEVALEWFKSTYSGANGPDCVEAALEWSKSSYSTNDGPSCVEIAPSPEAIHIRDSKNKQGPTLSFPPAQWTSFLTHVTREPLT